MRLACDSPARSPRLGKDVAFGLLATVTEAVPEAGAVGGAERIRPASSTAGSGRRRHPAKRPELLGCGLDLGGAGEGSCRAGRAWRRRAGCRSCRRAPRRRDACCRVDGSGEVEAARPRVAGLDAVGALVAEQEPVVVAVLAAPEGEIARLEARRNIPGSRGSDGREHGHVARRGDLLVVGQAGGIAEGRIPHADACAPSAVIMRAKFSSVPARFSAMVTAASLADWVTSALIASRP